MTVSRTKRSPAPQSTKTEGGASQNHKGGYRMVPSLLARVDGLPVTFPLPDRRVVWPTPSGERDSCRAMSSKRRARIERQTAVVHAAVLPAWARALIADQAAEAERLEIRSELARAGLL